jgi:putative two-component system response regulator
MMNEETILIVEDNNILREGWSETLREVGFNVLTAAHGTEALGHMNLITPDLILSDVSMPVMDGYTFYNEVRARPEWVTIPFIFLTARAEPQDLNLGRTLGADDYLTKPISREELVTTIRSRLSRFHQVQLAQVQQAYQASLTTLANAIEMRAPNSEWHIERMVAVSLAIAQILGWKERRMETLRFGAILHDIGKIQIPSAILFKTEPLTPAEWEVIHLHPVVGGEMVRGIPILEDAAAIIRHHHEHWNGTGYPDGLSGKAIPEGACIVCMADALDAIVSPRAYHSPRPLHEAYDEIVSLGGEFYSPILIDALQRAWRDGVIEQIYPRAS